LLLQYYLQEYFIDQSRALQSGQYCIFVGLKLYKGRKIRCYGADYCLYRW